MLAIAYNPDKSNGLTNTAESCATQLSSSQMMHLQNCLPSWVLNMAFRFCCLALSPSPGLQLP